MNKLVTNSILNSVKIRLGVPEDYRPFDESIVMDINLALNTLEQIGLSPEGGFVISGPEETWGELLQGRTDLEFVKTYVYLKTKKLFDPPTSSIVATAMDEQIKELEFRISAYVDRLS